MIAKPLTKLIVVPAVLAGFALLSAGAVAAPPVAPGPPVITEQPNDPTNQTSATVSFTGDAGATFLCSFDDGAYTACTSPQTFTDLADGPHALSVKATRSGLTSAATTAAWAVDTLAPAAPLLLQAPSGLTHETGASITIVGSVGTTATCSVDGGAWSACTSPVVLSGLVDGEHSLSVKSVDAAGNESQPTTKSWTVDTTPPAAPNVTGVPSSPTNQVEAQLSFTAEDGATFVCSVDGGDWNVCTPPLDLTGLADGEHSLEVAAIDGAANVSDSTTVSWTVDTVPPAIPGSFSGVPSSPTNQTGATISFTLGETGGTLECRLDSGSWEPCTSFSGTGGSFTVSGLSDGPHTISVRHTDAAGNVSAVGTSSSWTVDTTPPPAPTVTSQPPSTTTSTGANIAFTGSGGTFECKVDSGAWASCTSPIQLDSLAVGAHTVQIRETDEAGNTGAPASVNWTVNAPVCSPIPTPATPAGTVKLTRIKGGRWVMNAAAVFGAGGDARGCAQILTIQVSVDATKPLDSLAPPTTANFTNGVLAWTGRDVSRNGKQPRWMRVGNKIGRWSGWVEIKP